MIEDLIVLYNVRACCSPSWSFPKNVSTFIICFKFQMLVICFCFQLTVLVDCECSIFAKMNMDICGGIEGKKKKKKDRLELHMY